MKAIVTKYHGATNTRESRYSATDMDGNRVSIPTDHALNSDGNHDAVALALCRKMGWLRHNLMRGGIKGGNVYTFDTEYNRLEVK